MCFPVGAFYYLLFFKFSQNGSTIKSLLSEHAETVSLSQGLLNCPATDTDAEFIKPD